MMRLMRSRAFFALVLLLGCSSPPPAPAPPLRGAPDPARDELFARKGGWTGADAAYSVALTSSTTLWLFGDTLLGRWAPGAKMVRNSIGVQSGDEVEFFWGAKDTDFFAPQTPGTWLWPGDAFVEGERVGLFLHEFTRKGEGPFGFARTGLSIAWVANPLDAPSAWRVTYEKRPFLGEQLYYGIAACRVEEKLYVYGAVEELPRRWLVVARVERGRWEYLNEEGWGSAPTKPRRLCDGVAAELSVSRRRGGTVQLVTTENGLAAKIVLREADRPEGPFGPPNVIFTCPEPTWDEHYFTYAAKAHPELAREGEKLVITYCANSADFGELFKDPRIYRPRFVVVR
jgi:hypothetical protein